MARVRRNERSVLRVVAYLPAVYAAVAVGRDRGAALARRAASGLARPSHRPPFRSSSCAAPALYLTPSPSDKGSDEYLPRDDLNIIRGSVAGQVPSLDMLVDVISRESPDVLCLQEVVRGWMIDEQHDALGVLAGTPRHAVRVRPNIGDL